MTDHAEFQPPDAPACAICGEPFEHLNHGSTGREHDHDFSAPADHQPAPRPEGLKG